MNSNVKKNIAVFASGAGSNFINIHNKIKKNKINARICLLVSNNAKSGAVMFCIDNDINFLIYNDKRFPNDINNQELIDKMHFHKIDLILLAGYMKKISRNFIDLFNKKIMNVHPSLLPLYGGRGFYGMNVHNAVFKNKEKETGATIHFVDYNYDTGPILIQKKINIEKNDDPVRIADKVLKIEHQIYPKAVSFFCDNKISWNNNKPIIEE